MTLDDDARDELSALDARALLRVPQVVESAGGGYLVIDGQRMLDMSSNDYLGLAGDARLVRAASACLEEHGVGARASRLVVGNHRVHVELERTIAEWLGYEAVVTFSSGYAANVGVLTTLLRPGDVVFSDELNHASVIDGCRLSRAEIVVFPHRDIGALERELGVRSGRRRVVVSESLFSMEGDFADVAALAEIARRHDAAFVLDEAHALGVCGDDGRGVAAQVGVKPDVLVGTGGKALGTAGAFVATSGVVARWMWNRARSLVFSTGMPMSIAAATKAAIEVVRSEDGHERRQRAADLARGLRASVARARGDDGSPIVPVYVEHERVAMTLMKDMREALIFAQGIRPPTVPANTSRLRLSTTALHERNDVERVAAMLGERLKCFT